MFDANLVRHICGKLRGAEETDRVYELVHTLRSVLPAGIQSTRLKGRLLASSGRGVHAEFESHKHVPPEIYRRSCTENIP